MASRKGFVYDVVSRANPENTSPESSDYANVVDVGSLEEGTYSSDLTGLSDNTTYYYRAFGYDDDEELYVYGDEVSFTTLEFTTATVNNLDLSNQDYESFEASAEVTDDGGKSVTERGFVYNTTGTPNVDDDTKVISGDGTGTFQETISGLEHNTQYFVRAYAINEKGTSYSSEQNITTDEFGAPLQLSEGQKLTSLTVHKTRAPISAALLSVDFDGEATLELSNNAGSTWHVVDNGETFNFPSSTVDDEVRYRITAGAGGATVHAPIIVTLE